MKLMKAEEYDNDGKTGGRIFHMCTARKLVSLGLKEKSSPLITHIKVTYRTKNYRQKFGIFV